jgi:hypothetical protein
VNKKKMDVKKEKLFSSAGASSSEKSNVMSKKHKHHDEFDDLQHQELDDIREE